MIYATHKWEEKTHTHTNKTSKLLTFNIHTHTRRERERENCRDINELYTRLNCTQFGLVWFESSCSHPKCIFTTPILCTYNKCVWISFFVHSIVAFCCVSVHGSNVRRHTHHRYFVDELHNRRFYAREPNRSKWKVSYGRRIPNDDRTNEGDELSCMVLNECELNELNVQGGHNEKQGI